MSSTMSPHFESYLKGYLHCLYQHGYDDYDASDELYKLGRGEKITREQVKELYKNLDRGQYLVQMEEGLVPGSEPENKTWISRVTSWAYGALGYNERPQPKPFVLAVKKPAPWHDIVVRNLFMIIGPDCIDIDTDGVVRHYKNKGPDCVVTCNGEDSVMEEMSFIETAAIDVNGLLRIEGLKVMHWSVVPCEKWEENPAFHETEAKVYQEMDAFLSTTRYFLTVESFHIKCNRVRDVKCFLPHIRPRTLKKISIENHIDELEPEDEEVLNLEQFKRAEHVTGMKLNGSWKQFCKDFANFKNSEVEMTVPVDEKVLQRVCRHLLQNRKLEKMEIRISVPQSDWAPILGFLGSPGAACGSVRPWKLLNYQLPGIYGKKLRCNFDKNVFVFTGPEYKGPPVTCYV